MATWVPIAVSLVTLVVVIGVLLIAWRALCLVNDDRDDLIRLRRRINEELLELSLAAGVEAGKCRRRAKPTISIHRPEGSR